MKAIFAWRSGSLPEKRSIWTDYRGAGRYAPGYAGDVADPARTKRDWAAFNRPVIDKFRKDGGRTATRGGPVLLLTTTGARTGRARVTPLNFSRDGERFIVMASKGGSPTHPDWYRNLAVHPVVTVESDGERFTARATVSQGAERVRLLKIHTRAMPFFSAYERSVKTREIPVITLERSRLPSDRTSDSPPAGSPSARRVI